MGYLASLKNYFGKIGEQASHYFDAFLADPAVEQIHFIGKDIAYFHTLFWPAMLHFSGRKTPDKVYVHGFITLGGDKMSKSRGTGLSPLKYLEVGLDAEWLRYYIAAKLNAKVEDIEFNPDDFVARINSDLIGKYINIASRAAGFLTKRFAGRLSADLGVEGRTLLDTLRARQRRAARVVRGARVRQGAARSDAAGRPRQRIRRPPQALGPGQAGRPGRRAARRVQRVHRGFPPADDLPQAGDAGAGDEGRGLPARRAAGLGRCRARSARTPSAPTST